MSNSDMLRLSIGIAGGKPLGDYIALARLADEYGFHTFSIFDDLMFKPAWPILFAVAPHTQRMQIGPSVCNPYLVHPTILAGNAALLDEQTGGRAYLGIGRGAFLDFVGVEPSHPLTAVREAVALIRRLWSADRTPFEGKLFHATADAFLQWTPPRRAIPIMVGTWGMQMCRLAGAIADEVKAGSMWSADYGRRMWAAIADGARAAGRDQGAVRLVFGPLTSIGEDRAEARAHARRTLAFYLPFLAPMPEAVGVGPDVVAAVQAATARGDYDAAAALVPDLALDNFALCGTPNDVIESIERMCVETPVGRIEFGMPHGPRGSVEALHLLGKHVLPHFAIRE